MSTSDSLRKTSFHTTMSPPPMKGAEAAAQFCSIRARTLASAAAKMARRPAHLDARLERGEESGRLHQHQRAHRLQRHDPVARGGGGRTLLLRRLLLLRLLGAAVLARLAVE